MIYFLLLIPLVCQVARTDSGKIARSRENIRAWHRAHPCPTGPDKGSKTKCQGFVVDHLTPLCAGGVDGPGNYIWQELKESREKDKTEVALCRWIYKECGHPWRKK